MKKDPSTCGLVNETCQYVHTAHTCSPSWRYFLSFRFLICLQLYRNCQYYFHIRVFLSCLNETCRSHRSADVCCTTTKQTEADVCVLMVSHNVSLIISSHLGDLGFSLDFRCILQTCVQAQPVCDVVKSLHLFFLPEKTLKYQN